MKWEREFFRLAAAFLNCRAYLLHGGESGRDDAGAYVGMVDNATEMRMLLKEVRG
jgi:hypothetical protein